jgi:hypothetical protein
MTNQPILEKPVWNTKQIVIVAIAIVTTLVSCGGVYASVINQSLVDSRQDSDLIEIKEEMKAKIYNNSQLTYRLNSGQTKIFEEFKALFKEHAKMIHEGQKNDIRQAGKTDSILAIVKELKEAKK